MKTNRGIFLIEALMAAVVLTAGLIALLSASNGALRGGVEAGDRYRAALSLESLSCALKIAGRAAPESGTGHDPVLGALEWRMEPLAETGGDWRARSLRLLWTRRGRGDALDLPFGDVDETVK